VKSSEKLKSDGIWVCCNLKVMDYHGENDGIGEYEFWGQKCYDKGHDYIVYDNVEINDIDEILSVKNGVIKDISDSNVTLTDEQKELVCQYAIDNCDFEVISSDYDEEY